MTPYPSSSLQSIPWHRRLESRVLFWVTLVSGASLVALLLGASRVITLSSLEQSTDDLLAAREAFDHLLDRQAAFAEAQSRLITELPVFRAHLTDSRVAADPASVTEMAAEYRQELKAEFCVVTDAKGTWLARPGWPVGVAPPRALVAGIAAARSGRPSRDILTLPDGLFLVVFEPALFTEGDVLGTLTAGYPLDSAMAQLATDAHTDVTFVCDGARVCGSSLRVRERTDLASVLATDRARLGAVGAKPARLRIGAAEFVGGLYPLGGSSAGLILLQPWQPTQQVIDAMQTRLLWIGVITFLFALGGSLVFSRCITHPLRGLVNVANDIAAGEWTRRVPVHGPAEAKLMAGAFNHMTATLTHWHAEATRRSDELQDSYERFRAVTESATDAIVSVDSRGRIVFWNQRAEILFGYRADEAIGQSFAMLMPDIDRSHLADDLARDLPASAAPLVGRTAEVHGLRRDGSEVPLELSLSTWKAGKDVFYTGIVRDITERRQAEAALRQREEQLRQSQKMEAVGRLAGGIAHDFNNLLTAILGYADLGALQVPEGSQVHRDLLQIRNAGKSATALTRQLLAFGRKQVLQPVVLDLNDVVAQTEQLLRRLIGEDVELVMRRASRLPPVKADPGQMEQVLLNLAVNARDAMPDGGRLTIETRAIGRDVLLIVCDTGCGMTEEVRAQIFEPFFTTKDVGKGTGLGLSTVYGIVQQSGGTITVESQPERGTTFMIALPAVDGVVALVAAAPTSHEAAVHGSETVLLVEDNDSVRALAREVLGRDGYHVIEAPNGDEGLRLGTEHLAALDLVVTDLVMPGLGGHELGRRLHVLRPELRIIFTSGYTDDAVVRQGTLAPGSTFLQKPFAPEALGRLVREVLDARQLSN